MTNETNDEIHGELADALKSADDASAPAAGMPEAKAALAGLTSLDLGGNQVGDDGAPAHDRNPFFSES